MLMKAMAAYLNTTQLVTAFDEPPPNLEASDLPAVVLFWDGEEPTIVDPDMDGDMWTVIIRARIFAAAKEGNSRQEFADVSGLISPVVAAFNRHRVPILYLPGLDGTVGRLRVERIAASLDLEYGYVGYYGADVLLNAKFHTYYEET